MFDDGLTSVTGELGEFWDFPAPKKFNFPYILRQWGYIVWPIEAQGEAILNQNTFNNIGDVILYPHIVLSGLS